MAVSLVFSHSAIAAQMAIVSSQKAIIYSDQGLTSPLGFVRAGRQLMVGTTPRQNGMIVPVVVAGRVAYIQTKDITLSNTDLVAGQAPQGPKVTEHEVDLPMEEIKDDLKENNFLSLQLGQFFGGTQLEQLSEAAGVENTAITSYRIMFEHRPVIHRYFWDVGFGLYSLTNEEFSLQALSIEGNFYYSLFQSRFLTVQGFAGALFSGDFRITRESINEQSRGAAFGYQFGGTVKVATRQKWGFMGTAALQSILPQEIETVGYVLEDGSTQLTKLQSVHLSLGLVYKF